MTDASERLQQVRNIPHEGPRVETGAVQFGNDWPGFFIRGDQASYLAHCIGGWEMALDRAGTEVHPCSAEGYLLTQLRRIRDDIQRDVIVRPPAGRDAE